MLIVEDGYSISLGHAPRFLCPGERVAVQMNASTGGLMAAGGRKAHKRSLTCSIFCRRDDPLQIGMAQVSVDSRNGNAATSGFLLLSG